MSDGTKTSPGDELLRWVSECGSGSWDRLRDAAAYVSEKHGHKGRPWTLAMTLSALGHLDIDWTTREWSVAPCALNLVPNLGLCVVLTGSRPHHVDERFAEATDDLHVFPFSVAQPPAPAARFAKCASVEVAQRVADSLGVKLVIDPARGLVDAMRAVDEEPIQQPAPPPPRDAVRRFDERLLQWTWDDDQRPGLYRFDLHGRPVHRRLDEDGTWWAIDLAAGQFLAVRTRAERVTRWCPPTRDGRHASYVEVRHELSIPMLAERALTVSSGLAPRTVDGWRRYTNVPHDIAATVLSRLLQPLPS